MLSAKSDAIGRETKMKRSNGEGLFAAALLSLIGGAFLAVYGATLPTAEGIGYMIAGGAVVTFGIVFAVGGAIVRAIWFLPGDDEKL